MPRVTGSCSSCTPGCGLARPLALEWEGLNDFSKTLSINKNLAHTKEGRILQTPKTESGKRVIVLNKEAYNDDNFELVLFSRSIGHASVRTTLEIYVHLNMAVNTNTQREVKDLKDF